MRDVCGMCAGCVICVRDGVRDGVRESEGCAICVRESEGCVICVRESEINNESESE